MISILCFICDLRRFQYMIMLQLLFHKVILLLKDIFVGQRRGLDHSLWKSRVSIIKDLLVIKLLLMIELWRKNRPLLFYAIFFV